MKSENVVERVPVSEILPPVEDIIEPPPARATPDHFYPTGKPEITPSSPVPLDPECDPTASRGIPVFKPTWEEFQDFYKYVKSIDEWGLKSGIVKIIPPAQWKDNLPSTNALLPNVKIKQPITQHFMGRSGCYRQTNIVKRKNMSYKSWVEFAGPGGAWEAPNLRRIQLMEIMQEEDGQRRTRSGGVMRSMNSQSSSRAKRKKPQPKSLDEADTTQPKNEIVEDPASPQKETSTPISREDDEWYKSYDPSSQWLPNGMEAEDYTPEACRNLERLYWSSLTVKDGETAWYGADSQGTLFTKETKSWNVGKLKSYLTELLENAGFKSKLPGVTDPYLYFGMWKATFAWHVEDMDLYSINYIHHGAPKQWYAIPQIHAQRFENALASRFPMSMKECSEFLRHKSFVASPTTLADDGLHPNICVQHQGEFIITYPRGYHSGFNLGVNCAESVNFATKRWADLGRIAKKCRCVNDAVTINVDQLLQDAENLRRYAEIRKRSHQKRPFPEADISVPAKKKPKVLPPVYPCLFCPTIGEDHELLPVFSEPGKMAHKLCAGFIPETYITEIDGQDHIMGLESVPKARYNLKCQLCAIPRGLKVQCTKDKCCRAFHVTCAIKENSWVHLDVILDEKPSEPKIEIKTSPNNDTSIPEGAETQTAIVQTPQSSPADNIAPVSQLPAKVDAPEPIPNESNTVTENVRKQSPNRDQDKEEYQTIQSVMESNPSGCDSFQAVEDSSAQVVLCRNSASTSDSAIPDQATPSTSVPEHMAPETSNSSIRLVVLCRQHNPAYSSFKSSEKDKELFNLVKELTPGSLIKVKATGGVYQVQYLSYNEAKISAEILWEDGKKTNIKWRSIVFNDTVEVSASKKPPESVYAGPPKTVRSSATVETTNMNFPLPFHPQMSHNPSLYPSFTQFNPSFPYNPASNINLNSNVANMRENHQNLRYHQFHPSNFTWNPALAPYPPNLNSQMTMQQPMMWAPPPYPMYQQFRPVLADTTTGSNINNQTINTTRLPSNPSEKVLGDIPLDVAQKSSEKTLSGTVLIPVAVDENAESTADSIALSRSPMRQKDCLESNS